MFPDQFQSTEVVEKVIDLVYLVFFPLISPYTNPNTQEKYKILFLPKSG